MLTLSLSTPGNAANAATQDILETTQDVYAALQPYQGDGKWLIVMLWSANCRICNEEAPRFVRFQSDYGDSNAQVVGLSLDGVQGKHKAEQFIARHRLNYPNYIGEPLALLQVYTELTARRFMGTPSFLIFSPAGKIRAYQVGPLDLDRLLRLMAQPERSSAP